MVNGRLLDSAQASHWLRDSIWVRPRSDRVVALDSSLMDAHAILSWLIPTIERSGGRPMTRARLCPAAAGPTAVRMVRTPEPVT